MSYQTVNPKMPRVRGIFIFSPVSGSVFNTLSIRR